MRTIATVAATAMLLLASLSPALSQSDKRPGETEFGAFEALVAGEERTVTFTNSLRVELFCEVLDPPVSLGHVVLAHIEIIGPSGRRARARIADGGIAWTPYEQELPGEVIFRFIASAEAPWLPERVTVPAIRVAAGRAFIQLTPSAVALEVFPSHPCVYRFAIRRTD